MLPSTTHLDFLVGEGEIEALIHATEWSKTPLGPSASWPQSLKISVRIVLGNSHPMFLLWGEELILLYNAAYARMRPASRHPWAMGRPAREVWAESWNDVEPHLHALMHKGKSNWHEEKLLLLERGGFVAESCYTFSYSPIPDDPRVGVEAGDEGAVGGIICLVTEETKQALRQRAEEFKAHFNLTAVGNVQADASDGRLLLVNRAMCEIAGYSEAELLERTIWDITMPEDRLKNEQLFAELVRGECTSFELEKRFVRKDGEMRWGMVSVTVAQRDEAGRALRTGSVVLDITRRKQAEESLRQSEERYRLLFEAMHEGFMVGEIICNEQGEPVDYFIREANTGIERLVGRKREEMIGARALTIFPSLNQDLMRIAGRVALTGEPAEIEGFSPVLGWWYRSNVYSPRPRHFALVFVDISDRRRTEERMHSLNESLERRVEDRTRQVRESEERFRALVDASAQIVWTMNRYGRVVEDSPSWREFTGQSYEEGKGWRWMDSVHPDDRERTFEHWRKAVVNLLSIDTEFRIRHHSGEWYWMQVRAVPLYDETGAVGGWVGMNIDIHERKQAEADRERLARSLIMAEQEERRRISQVLHDDLQQLLYATQMRIAMISQDLQDVGQTNLQEELEEARSWLRQCVETTRQMTVDLSPPILKNEGLADALEWLLPQMEQRHGLTMVLHARDNLRIADEDLRALLFQIVRELLFNVAKHAGVDRVVVELEQEDDHLVIHVIDEGRGFDTDKITERKSPQGGFGLFSVQERLRLVGGQMEVHSHPGAGTHVIIHAPAQSQRLAS